MDNLESEGEGNKKYIDVHPCCKQGSRVVWGCLQMPEECAVNPGGIIAVRVGFTFHSVVRVVHPQLRLLSGQWFKILL
jgi:hypothetical protein